MIATVKRSTPEEIAQLLCDLHEETNALRKDKERLDWLEKEQVYVGYDVERCAYGLGFDAAYADTIRGAIDAGMDSANAFFTNPSPERTKDNEQP